VAIFVAEVDTTAGQFREGPVSAPFQPRVVRVAAGLYTDKADEVAMIDLTIKPDGWSVPDTMAEIHGTTTELANKRGIPIKTALSAIVHLADQAEVLVSYRAGFLCRVIQGELERSGVRRHFPPIGQEAKDLVRTSAALCKLRKDKPENPEDFRLPTLTEACSIILKDSTIITDRIHARYAMASSLYLYHGLRGLGALP
jgi:hypothetical protein